MHTTTDSKNCFRFSTQKSSARLDSSIFSNLSSLSIQSASDIEQFAEKQSTKAKTKTEKISENDIASSATPISSIYSQLNSTTKTQAFDTRITDSSLSSVSQNKFLPVCIGLNRKQVDSSATQTTAGMLRKIRVDEESKLKEKEVPPIFRQIQEYASSIEWVRLTPNIIILATPEKVWVYRPESEKHSNFFAQPSINTGNIATTKKLLDTAIVLAKRAANLKQKPSALTPLTWVWSLISQYHLTHFTPQLMKQASRYFANRGQKHLAHWAAQKAIEESGHDRLALLDIQSLGYKAEALVQAFISPSAATLLDYFIDSVQVSDPIKCVGYSYTLERLALAINKEHIQVVEEKMPSNTKATRCLRVHSSIGSDVEHVEEIIEVMTKLTPEDRNQITIACYETALLYFSSSEGDYPSEQELEQKLQAFEY